MDTETQYVAILRQHDRTEKKAILVPAGQTLEFDEGDATRRWLWPYLGEEWHLAEFIPINMGTT